MILVIVFNLGVAGVAIAIATVTSNVISAAMVVYFLVNEEGDIKLSLKDLSLHSNELKKILISGVPAGLQTTVFSIANLFIQVNLNGYGSDAGA